MHDLNPLACKLIDLAMVATLAGFAVHIYHTEYKNENMRRMSCHVIEQSAPAQILPSWV
jgi:hypothetical protein